MKDSADIERRLEAAASACVRAGTRFTGLRRHVLALVLRAPGPVTAYALLDRLKETHRTAAPPTVYRALEFLQQQGLIHRVERLQAFVGCDEEAAHSHAAQFLICRTCGGVDEVDDHGVADALGHAAAAKGFTPAHSTVEVEGTCAACFGAAQAS
ncbi:MAG TPA: transcriptional repressor [Acetobacteraceae bacterium]